MIFLQWRVCTGISFLFTLFLFYCAITAYRKNLRRESDDPKKKDFSPAAPWLTPITPFFWLGRKILLAPWSILLGIFLIVFPFILFIFHPLPEDDPITRFILKVGNGVLKINTRFLHALGLEAKPIRFTL